MIIAELKVMGSDKISRPGSRLVSRERIHQVLSAPLFLDRIFFEKRRVERTKGSLSIVVLSLAGESPVVSICEEVLGWVVSQVRETDVVGFLDEYSIGILLLGTDKVGCGILSRRIRSNSTANGFSLVEGTYPDEIFERLLPHAAIEEDWGHLWGGGVKRSRLMLFAKSAIDFIGAGVGVVVFLPVMLLVALMIKASSPGPVFFKQIRLGRNGVPFTLYKFRSMHINVDDALHRDYISRLIGGADSTVNQGDSDSPFFKIRHDPRVTTVGRFIRKTSLDELPQLFNVLKRDMSLVGPRPPLPYEVAQYQAWHLRRIFEVLPGITGLWQVEGRSKTTFDDMVRLDIQYIQHWSIALDIQIIIKTIPVVIKGFGGA